MKSFKDKNGTEWSLDLDPIVIDDVKKETEVNFYTVFDKGFAGLQELLSNPRLLVDVLYVCCRDQADKAGISDRDFGRSFRGENVVAAGKALTAEIFDFFQSAEGTPLKKMLAKVEMATEKIHQKATRDLEAAIEKVSVNDLAQQMLKSISGDSSASSASRRAS